MSARDPRFLKGVAHFNAREFYDAHETWEELWHTLHGKEADFVKGLIQYATALHHFRSKNLKGVRTLVSGATALLLPLGETFWDVPLATLIAEMTTCAQDVLARDAKELPGRYDAHKETFPVTIDESLIPTITLRSAA